MSLSFGFINFSAFDEISTSKFKNISEFPILLTIDLRLLADFVNIYEKDKKFKTFQANLERIWT